MLTSQFRRFHRFRRYFLLMDRPSILVALRRKCWLRSHVLSIHPGRVNNNAFSSRAHYAGMIRQVFSITPPFSIRRWRKRSIRRSGEHHVRNRCPRFENDQLPVPLTLCRRALCRFHSYPDLCDWSQGRWRWFPHQWSFIYIRVLPRNVEWLIPPGACHVL